MMRMKMTAKKFAELNGVSIEEIKEYSDACVGAEGLTEEVELEITIEDGMLTVRRYDNEWNDGIEVIAGKLENWNVEWPVI
jgi:hypothetical protein